MYLNLRVLVKKQKDIVNFLYINLMKKTKPLKKKAYDGVQSGAGVEELQRFKAVGKKKPAYKRGGNVKPKTK